MDQDPCSQIAFGIILAKMKSKKYNSIIFIKDMTAMAIDEYINLKRCSSFSLCFSRLVNIYIIDLISSPISYTLRLFSPFTR